MPLTLILTHPALGLAWVIAILTAIGIHEYAHAAAGTRLGDPTARDAGRLTLNPLAHVDPLGFLMLLLVGFGWGRPVPFDPRKLRAPRWGPSVVALAGPTANLLAATITGLVLSAINRTEALPANNLLVFFLAFSFQIHVVLLLFNLLPIPPLDGSKLLLGLLDHPRYDHVRSFLETRGPFILLTLVLLDGLLGGAIIGRFLHAAFRTFAGIF